MASFFDQDVDQGSSVYTPEKTEQVLARADERDARKKRREEKRKKSSSKGLIMVPLNPGRMRLETKYSSQPTIPKTDFDIFNESISNPTTSATTTEATPNLSNTFSPSNKDLQKLTVNQNELQYGKEDEDFDPGDPIHLMTGITRVWRPPYWKERLLINREFQFVIKGTLRDLAADILNTNIYKLTGSKFWEMFQTGTKDDYWLCEEMSSMHNFRQHYHSITPITVHLDCASDLPFPVHLISQSNFDQNTNTYVPDQCNQAFFDDGVSKTTFKYLSTIEPGSKSSGMKKVSDFTVAYSPDYVRTIFKIQREQIKACWKVLAMGGNSVATILVGSHLEKTIIGLSNMSNPAFKDKRPLAERLTEQMIHAEQRDFWKTGKLWYMDLDSELVTNLVEFIESLTMTIPKFNELCYKIQPVPGVEWMNPATWSLQHIKKMGISKLIFGGNGNPDRVTQLLETKIFTVSVTMKHTYL